MNQQPKMPEMDITPQDGTNPEPEVVEDTVAEETTETPAQETKTYSSEEFRQVLARAKKAEAALKTQPKPPQTITQNALSQDDIDTRILKSQGMTDVHLDSLKKVAKINNTSLIEAQSDPIFQAIKEKEEREAKAQKAKLPASRGSASVKKEVNISSPGLTDAQHKELWRESQGR